MMRDNNTANKVGLTPQACAVCKYQRRKCGPDCPLAPYFPPHRQRDFQNARKLFGVKNILKTINNLSPLQRQMALSSIIYQSNARATDPVGGCARMILKLRNDIHSCKKELEFVRQQLHYYKSLNDGDDLVDHLASHEGKKSIDKRKEPREPTKIADQETLANQENLKIGENKFELLPTFAEEQSCTLADISEAVRPFLGGFHEKDNTFFFDSNEVALKDEDTEEHDLKSV